MHVFIYVKGLAPGECYVSKGPGTWRALCQYEPSLSSSAFVALVQRD